MVSAGSDVGDGEHGIGEDFALHVEVVLHDVRPFGVVGQRGIGGGAADFGHGGVKKFGENILYGLVERWQGTRITVNGAPNLVVKKAQAPPTNRLVSHTPFPAK